MRQIDWVTLHRLDVPECPGIFLVNLEDVHLLLESVVAVLNVLKSRLAPVNTNVCAVDEPLNEWAIYCRDVEIHGEMLYGFSEVLSWHLVRSIRSHALIVAGDRLGNRVLGGRFLIRSALVSDNRSDRIGSAIAPTACGDIGSQPVITDILVGIDNYIVALTDVD